MNLELTVVGTASESLAHGPDFVVLVGDEGDGRGAYGQQNPAEEAPSIELAATSWSGFGDRSCGRRFLS